MKYVILTLYGAGVVGAMVSNYLAVTAFLWPVYGASAVFVGLVFDAVWLGASFSWIVLGNRDWMTKAMLVGGVVAATAIQFWVGWSEAGALGQAVVMAGDGQNYFMAALAILRHAVMPVIGLASVHALGRDWPKLTTEEEATATPAVPSTLATVTPDTVDRIMAAVATQTAVLDELVDTVATMTTAATAFLTSGHAAAVGRPSAAAQPRSATTVTTATDPAVAAAIEAGIPRTTARRWAEKGDPQLDKYRAVATANGQGPG